MWNPEHCRSADRHGLRYPCDLIDAEWALLASIRAIFLPGKDTVEIVMRGEENGEYRDPQGTPWQSARCSHR